MEDLRDPCSPSVAPPPAGVDLPHRHSCTSRRRAFDAHPGLHALIPAQRQPATGPTRHAVVPALPVLVSAVPVSLLFALVFAGIVLLVVCR